ncbi:hypothetical protein [Devosia salina]|uniref:hypothetical protein n=1 Tax=Devosia salina TaxID=2860336 RepID=UPI001F0A9606|nr:hypothetical protein [Devosia salina]
MGEQIAVAIADRNSGNLCLAAHTGLVKNASATAVEMTEAQAGRSSDPRTSSSAELRCRTDR